MEIIFQSVRPVSISKYIFYNSFQYHLRENSDIMCSHLNVEESLIPWAHPKGDHRGRQYP